MLNAHVQFGCGFAAPSTWRNFDASPTLRFERLPVLGRLYTKNGRRFPANVEYGDILLGLPVPRGSCAGVYCSHVLQDLPLDQCRLALQQTFELLRPGGLFRMVLPDLEYSVRKYIESADPLAAMLFMREGKFGVEVAPRRLSTKLARSLESSLGSRQRWMWDFKSLAYELKQAGFSSIRRCEAGDAADPVFADVEDPRRFQYALAIECAKERT
ncbi:MAG: class I SAM-dependent methyltransferase [Gemmatimonadaceae bacterium]